jgi:hypothetical protein
MATRVTLAMTKIKLRTAGADIIQAARGAKKLAARGANYDAFGDQDFIFCSH